MEETYIKLSGVVVFAFTFLLFRESFKDHDYTRVSRQKPVLNHQHEYSTVVGREGLSILLVGRVGTGKSTLVNGLIGRKEERIGNKYSSFNLEKLNINGVPLTLMFWNSPKQQDADSSEIKQRITEVDLVMYAIRMDDARIQPRDRTILQTLSRLFGRTFWNKAMFVLTFANRVEFLGQRHIPQRSKEHLNQKRLLWESFIHTSLAQEGLADAELRDIPIVPVGHYSDLKMFEDDEDWTVLFVNSMFRRLSVEVRPALMNICKHCHHL